MSILCVGVAPNDGKLKGLLFYTLKYTASLHIELVVTAVFRRFSILIKMCILQFFLFETNVGVMVFFETNWGEYHKCNLGENYFKIRDQVYFVYLGVLVLLGFIVSPVHFGIS